jgi:membrane protein DedA with SNARE-associated domain
MDTIQTFFYTYGYLTVFLFLYCGLIGIPAAEESFMIFVGITLSQIALPSDAMSLALCIMLAATGSSSGMLTAYLIGYWIGTPFLRRFGKFIGLTPARWQKAEAAFRKHAFLAIFFGYFIPGVRQINPYLAGLSRARLLTFLTAALSGSSVWATVFILLGYFVGNEARRFIEFGPAHVIFFGVLLFIAFIVFTVFQIKKKR